jgi:hypothetical protein
MLDQFQTLKLELDAMLLHYEPETIRYVCACLAWTACSAALAARTAES